MKKQIVSQVRSLVLFVICMSFGFRAEASSNYEVVRYINVPNAKGFEKYFGEFPHVQRGTPDSFFASGQHPLRKRRAIDCGLSGVEVYDEFSHDGNGGKVAIIRLTDKALVWVDENNQPMYLYGCCNRLALVTQPAAPREVAQEQVRECPVKEFFEQVIGRFIGSVNSFGDQCAQFQGTSYQSYVPQYVQQCYPQAPQTCERVRERTQQTVNNYNSTFIDNSINNSFNKTVTINRPRPTPPCTPFPHTTSGVVASGTQTQVDDNGNPAPTNRQGAQLAANTAPAKQARSAAPVTTQAAAENAVALRASAKAKVVTPATPSNALQAAMLKRNASPTIALRTGQSTTTPNIRTVSSAQMQGALGAKQQQLQAALGRRTVGGATPNTGRLSVSGGRISPLGIQSSQQRQLQAALGRRNSGPAVNYSGGQNQLRSAVTRQSSSFVSPARNYRSPVSNYRAPVNNYRAPVNNYRAPANNYRAPMNSYRAPAVSYSAPRSYSAAPSGRRR